jgi:hypothetical protein
MEETIGFDLRSIVPDPSWTAERRTRHLLRRDVPAVRSVDTQGYDVADYWMLSGLTNCGYKPEEEEEAASPAPVWGPRLNDWHLFADPDDAETFADVMDKRVPEHAPFYAFGLYQLR